MPTKTEYNIDPRTVQVEWMYLNQHIKKNWASELLSHVSWLATKILKSFYIFYCYTVCLPFYSFQMKILLWKLDFMIIFIKSAYCFILWSSFGILTPSSNVFVILPGFIICKLDKNISYMPKLLTKLLNKTRLCRAVTMSLETVSKFDVFPLIYYFDYFINLHYIILSHSIQFLPNCIFSLCKIWFFKICFRILFLFLTQ